jgi:hypothetical protein
MTLKLKAPLSFQNTGNIPSRLGYSCCIVDKEVDGMGLLTCPMTGFDISTVLVPQRMFN